MLLERILLPEVYRNDQEYPNVRVIKIRQDGFQMQNGLSDQFNTVFPHELRNHITMEQFEGTMHDVNAKLREMNNLVASAHYLGVLLCLCTCGISLCLSRLCTCYIVKRVQEILDKENEDVYTDLGVYWKISMDKVSKEYVLLISIAPRITVTSM